MSRFHRRGNKTVTSKYKRKMLNVPTNQLSENKNNIMKPFFTQYMGKEGVSGNKESMRQAEPQSPCIKTIQQPCTIKSLSNLRPEVNFSHR